MPRRRSITRTEVRLFTVRVRRVFVFLMAPQARRFPCRLTVVGSPPQIIRTIVKNCKVKKPAVTYHSPASIKTKTEATYTASKKGSRSEESCMDTMPHAHGNLLSNTAWGHDYTISAKRCAICVNTATEISKNRMRTNMSNHTLS